MSRFFHDPIDYPLFAREALREYRIQKRLSEQNGDNLSSRSLFRRAIIIVLQEHGIRRNKEFHEKRIREEILRQRQKKKEQAQRQQKLPL